MRLQEFKVTLTLKIFFFTLLLLFFGLIMIYSASVSEALRDFDNKWHFVLLQLKWAGFGLVGLIVASRFPIKLLEKLAPLALII